MPEPIVETIELSLPAVPAVGLQMARNPVRQLLRLPFSGPVRAQRIAGRGNGTYILSRDGLADVLITEGAVPRNFAGEVLRVPRNALQVWPLALQDGQQTKWVSPRPITETDPGRLGERAEAARASWRGAFSFRQADPETGDRGLRAPQIGALHAVLGHWSVSRELATVVMPTGTGKTETMLVLLAHERCEKLLVVVPTSPLREQTFEKFLSFGLLKRLGILADEAILPLVGKVQHQLRSVEDADRLFDSCNVVVATMAALAGCADEVLRRVAERASHLFIDEAHHVPSRTWAHVRRFFSGKHVLQFTATPFRRDGKRVDGRIVYSYPLRRAQQEDYFRPIRFQPVWEFDAARADDAIAEAAVRQLEADLRAGLDHLAMARVDTVARAEAVLAVYERQAPRFRPVAIHSGMGTVACREAMRRLRSRESRVVVCVDMLGEGFDFAELKVAALHDAHKSLAITLQFTGRFTRSKEGVVGDATVVANLASVSVEESLRELYAEDADWNQLIRRLGEGAVARQVRKSEFLSSFTDLPDEVPIQNIAPKMSTVAYRVAADDWDPGQIEGAVDESLLFSAPSVSEENQVALFVTRETEPVSWGQVYKIENVVWHLYLLHFDRDRRLLFINSSNNATVHEGLAEAVGGDDVELVKGPQVFRILGGVGRLILMNVGLRHALGRSVRHTSHMGGDVGEAITAAQLANKTRTNVFGRGYAAGEKVTVGCSGKGRLWSHRIAEDISDWVDWCHSVGDKLLDEGIDVDEVLRGAIIPVPAEERPPLVPLAIEWPEPFYERNEDTVRVIVAGREVPFYDAGLELVDHERDGEIRFRVTAGDASAEYRVSFSPRGLSYFPTGEAMAEVVTGRRRRSLTDCFKSEPPRILFERDTFIEDDQLHVLRRPDARPYPAEAIQVWDWTGVDLSKESQKDEKRPDSIQRRVIERLLGDPSWDIVFDDDEANEAADVVALRVQGDELLVHLYHCKWATKGRAGARVKDLYEVCGQAQKSVRWREHPEHLLDHLRWREDGRRQNGRPSRFEKGGPRDLLRIKNTVHLLSVRMAVTVVQPGVSQAEVTNEQLELLASTELYLQETFGIGLTVVASA